MSKARVRRPAPSEASEQELSWGRRRSWVPLLVMAIVVVAVLGSGLLVDKALQTPAPQALAGCQTSVQVAPHEFIGPQPMCINASQSFDATINTTQGPIVVHLYPEIAPVTVNNFIVLAIHGYYDGLTFWKSEDWVVQSGDPQNDGRGGPGYNLPDEPSTAPDWGLGAVGMARPPGSAVNGSQFFIQKADWPAPGPTAVYNRFGTVTSGLDKAQLLTATDTITSISIKVS
ncbi:MAG TPA: peptidylprolyl isomerase [Candidatus Dormibacteraeota bacterium]|nr:peptidylprolyl isomerase [Candidatus Dormibacteraeota bacterium]